VWRELDDAEQDGPGERPIQPRADVSRQLRLQFGEPVSQALFGGTAGSDMRPAHEPRGQGGGIHATFCGTSCVWAASLSPAADRAGMTSVAVRPGWASPSLSSPPCRVATADA